MTIKVGSLVTTKQNNTENSLKNDNLGIVIEILDGVDDAYKYSTWDELEDAYFEKISLAYVYWFRFNEDRAGQLSCYQPISYLIVVSTVVVT